MTVTSLCTRHPQGSWVLANGGCYVCWCEDEIVRLRELCGSEAGAARGSGGRSGDTLRRLRPEPSATTRAATNRRGNSRQWWRRIVHGRPTFLCKHCEGTGTLTDGITGCPRCHGRGATT